MTAKITYGGGRFSREYELPEAATQEIKDFFFLLEARHATREKIKGMMAREAIESAFEMTITNFYKKSLPAH